MSNFYRHAIVSKRILLFVLVLLAVLTLSSCAPAGYTTYKAGFFTGLWQGFILVFSIIGKIFGLNIGISAVNNTGFTYWLGYFIGVCILGGGSFFSGRR